MQCSRTTRPTTGTHAYRNCVNTQLAIQSKNAHITATRQPKTMPVCEITHAQTFFRKSDSRSSAEAVQKRHRR